MLRGDAKDNAPPENLPGREVGDCYWAAYQLPEPKQSRMVSLLDVFDNGDFWCLPRKVQSVMLLQRRKAFKLSQKVIAILMGVAPSTMCKYKYDFLEYPEQLFRLPGRPSKIRDVFPQVETSSGSNGPMVEAFPSASSSSTSPTSSTYSSRGSVRRST